MSLLAIIITVFLITSNCKAQIVPVEEQRNYSGEETGYPDGIDFLDVNNVFMPMLVCGKEALWILKNKATIFMSIPEWGPKSVF